ncbi:YtxH domain-containing protein [Pontibacter sp. MBLB2868]|uniref:YtxH domain-containing protein n=1 Tax=Pontibacter sp. MBLB2868 TaxID=3451555 RepID=UPI003F75382A
MKQMDNMNKDNSKILMATLAGIGAGVVAGIMLAPENGKATRESVMRSLYKASDELNTSMKSWTDNLKTKLSQGGASEEDDQLVMHGSWEDVKGQLRQNYEELTEEDLSYQQGSEHELLDRIQRRLGKTKDEVIRLLSELR